MTSALDYPDELWLHVFSFLPRADKLSLRCTCGHFRQLLDSSSALWRDFHVVLRNFSRYSSHFWRSLAQRHTARVSLKLGKKQDLRKLCARLPSLHTLRLDSWDESGVPELRRFAQLRHLSVTCCSKPLDSLDFLPPLSRQLTQLTICNVRLTCPTGALIDAVAQLRRLTCLVLHHDGSRRFPPPSRVLAHLPELRRLSWSMVQYKTLSEEFFDPALVTEGGDNPTLSHLQLVDYDAMVKPQVLQPLWRLSSLSIYHMYSVPGPSCHLQTWLSALAQLRSLHVAGGHALAVYADFLPPSLLSLSLEVDMQPEDLKLVSQRVPQLKHLHLEPWGSPGLLGLIPQLFPNLTTLRIRQRDASDDDILRLQDLQHLQTLELIESFCSPGGKSTVSSQRAAQTVARLQQLVHHKFRVVTGPQSDLLTCNCIASV
ncbi:uncharacterized protein ACB058_017789 [Synchiropus picturatus]